MICDLGSWLGDGVPEWVGRQWGVWMGVGWENLAAADWLAGSALIEGVLDPEGMGDGRVCVLVLQV